MFLTKYNGLMSLRFKNMSVVFVWSNSGAKVCMYLYTKDWSAPNSSLYVIWLLRKLKSLIPMIEVTWKSPLSTKFSANFSPIVPPSAAGVRSRRFRREERLVAGVGSSNHWSSKLGVWRAAGNGTLKIFRLRIHNDSWAGHNPQGLQCRLKKKNII